MNYDCIVIGSGAGGSAAAYRLVKAGKRVLLIEKGQALPVDGSTLDFKKVIDKGLFKSKEPWLDRYNKRFVPEEYFNLGGKTKWYGAALLRFAPSEFEPEPEIRCLGWPVSYEDMEPYYEEAEKLLGVLCFDIEPDLEVLRDRIDRQNSGWLSSPVTLALNQDILTEAYEARHFDGFASVKGLKSDGQTTLISRVIDSPDFSLITGQSVDKLVGSAGNPVQVTGVRLKNGREYFAGNVVLAAGALHSPRLLHDFLSENGLAAKLSCAGQVGGNFKRHLLTAMLSFSPSKKTDALRKTTVWLNDRFPHSSVQPLGFSEDVLTALLPRLIPRWLARFLGARGYGFFLQTEDGSDPRNRVSAVVLDAGIRRPKLDYDPKRFPELLQEHRHMIRSFRSALSAAGCISFIKTIPLSGTAHACGTLVAGNDPEQSVVDRFGKVHGLDNLYVVDGSVLPRSSRVNPALTIYAWALRTADHLLGDAS